MMADEVAPDETTSDDAPDETETPSEPVDDGEEPAEKPEDEPEAEEDGAPPEGDPAVVNLEKKFAHIKDSEQRRVAVAKAYWEKTNYAAKTRRENEKLVRRNAELEARTKAPDKPAEPPPPDPDLQELDSRIQVLRAKDQSALKESDQELEALNIVDVEIAKLQGKAEDAKEAGDDGKVRDLENRIEMRQSKRESIIRRYRDLQDRRQGISWDYERMVRDRAWLSKVIEDRTTSQDSAKQELESFKVDFPEKVDGLIEAAGQRLGVPEHLLEDLLEEVNDGLLVDLWRLGEADLDDVDVPALVSARVEKFARIRDVTSRQRFKDKSDAKLKVTTPAGRPAVTPGTRRNPIAPASMQANELGPKMRKARDYLASKGLG